jgi:hypothetical protein
MGQARVKSSRLSSTATILMIVLGVFTLIEVSFIVGVALILVGAAMYLFNWWMRGRF